MDLPCQLFFSHDLDKIIDFSGPVTLEDDLHYAELERQILKLTADDDEDDGRKPFEHIIIPSRRASNATVAEAPFIVWRDFAPTGNMRNPVFQIKSNGTGVFIPRVIRSQPGSSSGRTSKNRKRRTHKQK